MLFDFMAALAVTGGFAVLIGLLRPDFYRWAPKFGPVLLVPKASAFDVSQRLATASPAAKWVVMIAIAIGGLQVLSWWTVPVLFALFMVVAHFAPETLDRLLGPNHVFHYKEWWKNRIPAWSLPVASVAGRDRVGAGDACRRRHHPGGEQGVHHRLVAAALVCGACRVDRRGRGAHRQGAGLGVGQEAPAHQLN